MTIRLARLSGVSLRGALLAGLVGAAVLAPGASANVKCTATRGALDIQVVGKPGGSRDRSIAVIKRLGHQIRVIRFDEQTGQSHLVSCVRIKTVGGTNFIYLRMHRATAFVSADLRTRKGALRGGPAVNVYSRARGNTLFITAPQQPILTSSARGTGRSTATSIPAAAAGPGTTSG